MHSQAEVPSENPPPWIQTMTGSPSSSFSHACLRPAGAQMLAVKQSSLCGSGGFHKRGKEGPIGELHTAGAVGGGIDRLLTVLHRLRRQEPECAEWRRHMEFRGMPEMGSKPWATPDVVLTARLWPRLALVSPGRARSSRKRKLVKYIAAAVTDICCLKGLVEFAISGRRHSKTYTL